MNTEQAWNIIINSLTEKDMEFPTVPNTQRTPVWFSAKTNGEKIFINVATKNTPSSKITKERKLKYTTFQKIYPLYLRRENGEEVSHEAKEITVNQVYYYSLIKHLCNK